MNSTATTSGTTRATGITVSLTVSADALARALRLTAHGLLKGARGGLPVHRGVQLAATSSTLTLTTFNGQTSVRAALPTDQPAPGRARHAANTLAQRQENAGEIDGDHALETLEARAREGSALGRTGIRDDGTATKPIEIDPVPVKVDSEDEDDDMEDVPMYVSLLGCRYVYDILKATATVLRLLLQARMNHMTQIFGNIVGVAT